MQFVLDLMVKIGALWMCHSRSVAVTSVSTTDVAESSCTILTS